MGSPPSSSLGTHVCTRRRDRGRHLVQVVRVFRLRMPVEKDAQLAEHGLLGVDRRGKDDVHQHVIDLVAAAGVHIFQTGRYLAHRRVEAAGEVYVVGRLPESWSAERGQVERREGHLVEQTVGGFVADEDEGEEDAQ
uniref:Uncharacterized protein n=1 Tax=Corethron hystrix TaxID=216773 RepID=A0A7S1FRR5_9STRA